MVCWSMKNCLALIMSDVEKQLPLKEKDKDGKSNGCNRLLRLNYGRGMKRWQAM